jgi:Domain of unknown function (DUF1905)
MLALMDMEFSGEIIFWRGPAPWHFVPMPERESADLQENSGSFSYGWGCIPVRARIGDTTYTTSLFPKDGRYLVPVKTAVRRAEGVELGDVVTIQLNLEPGR